MFFKAKFVTDENKSLLSLINISKVARITIAEDNPDEVYIEYDYFDPKNKEPHFAVLKADIRRISNLLRENNLLIEEKPTEDGKSS